MIGEVDIFLIVFLAIIVVAVLLSLLLARTGLIRRIGKWFGKESRIIEDRLERKEEKR